MEWEVRRIKGKKQAIGKLSRKTRGPKINIHDHWARSKINQGSIKRSFDCERMYISNGRSVAVTLTESILNGIPILTYFMASFRIPSSMYSWLKKMMKDFLPKGIQEGGGLNRLSGRLS